MLCGPLAKRGYLRWWHSFSGVNEAGERRSFFIEYSILNPVPEKKRKVKTVAPSYVRIYAGIFPGEGKKGFQLDSRYPISTAKYARKPLYFQVSDNIMRETRITGRIKRDADVPGNGLPCSGEGSIEWDLEIYKTIACHVGILASPLLCAVNALDTFFHGEGIKTHFRGHVTVNGEIYSIDPDNCNGYADKHWGRDYNDPWLQIASCDLLSERTGKLLKHSALVIDGCCPRFLFFRFKPRMILQLTYTGEDFYYSFANPFSRPRLKWGTKESTTSFTWHVKAANKNSLIKLSIQSPKDRMFSLKYDRPRSIEGDPAASPRLRAGTEGFGTLDLYRLTPEGKEWIDTLTVQNALCEFQKPPKKASAQ